MSRHWPHQDPTGQRSAVWTSSCSRIPRHERTAFGALVDAVEVSENNARMRGNGQRKVNEDRQNV